MDGTEHWGATENSRRSELTRRMAVVAGGLTLLTAAAGEVAAAADSGGKRAAAARPTVPKPRARPVEPSPAAAARPSGPTTPDPGATTPGRPNGVGLPAAAPQYYVAAGGKAIALTIDDGPDGRYTPKVLALLAQYEITATFCMLGSAAATHAGLVQEVSAAGHGIANHTYTHSDVSKMEIGTVRGELARANDALAGAGARPPTLFRAPYGAWSPAVFEACRDLGLRPLDWSVDPRDWSRPGADHIVDTVLSRTHAGSIILEHDGGGDRSQTVAALTRFLPRLLAAGYTFVQP